MTENMPLKNTETEKQLIVEAQNTVTGVKCTLKLHLTIRFRIQEFETLMDSCEPGECLSSERASSELACAEWMLQVYPNGWKEDRKGYVSAFLHLVGPMTHSGKTIDAAYCIYFIDESDNRVDVAAKINERFRVGWGSHVDHERAKDARKTDGSLLVAAEVEFLLPCDGEVEVVCKGCALGGDETQQGSGVDSSELHTDKDSSDHSSIEIQRRLMEKLLSARNVIVTGPNSLETLKEECIKLIAREWDDIFRRVEWMQLTKYAPKLKTDLVDGAVALLAKERQ